jgi:hypothetical protein
VGRRKLPHRCRRTGAEASRKGTVCFCYQATCLKGRCPCGTRGCPHAHSGSPDSSALCALASSAHQPDPTSGVVSRCPCPNAPGFPRTWPPNSSATCKRRRSPQQTVSGRWITPLLLTRVPAGSRVSAGAHGPGSRATEAPSGRSHPQLHCPPVSVCLLHSPYQSRVSLARLSRRRRILQDVCESGQSVGAAHHGRPPMVWAAHRRWVVEHRIQAQGGHQPSA